MGELLELIKASACIACAHCRTIDVDGNVNCEVAQLSTVRAKLFCRGFVPAPG
jgi:hypothetical protein